MASSPLGLPRPLITRRTALRGAATALGALSLSGCTDEGPAARAPFGRAPDADSEAAMVPEEARPDGVLELFLPGGLNAFDSFYVVPAHTGTQWHLFQSGPNSIPHVAAACLLGGEPLLLPFANDTAGQAVSLGPFVVGLRRRADLLARLRVVVMRHDQAPHQTAIPLALCGQRLGSPRLAGGAAHAQRFFGDLAPRDLPYGWVLSPDLADLSDFNGDVGAALGAHPGTARPLEIHLAAFARLQDQLTRSGLPVPAERFDAAVGVYRGQLAARLRREGRPIRAALQGDYEHARQALSRSAAIRDAFSRFPTAGEGSVCGAAFSPDQSSQGLDVAVQLLTHPTTPARWVTSIDGGLGATSVATAYDTHTDHVRIAARNVTHVLEALAARINEPGEGDPNKLDLDRHLVVLTTEFGRSPFIEGSDGLDHWPDGYVQILLGGPVRAEDQGVIGSIDAEGLGTDATHPAAFRAALLLAQGIWPFHPAGFDVGDVADGADPIEAARALRARIWGRT